MYMNVSIHPEQPTVFHADHGHRINLESPGDRDVALFFPHNEEGWERAMRLANAALDVADAIRSRAIEEARAAMDADREATEQEQAQRAADCVA